MASSALLRRWISRSGAARIFRSDANSNHSLYLRNSCCCRELAANRTISTRIGVSSFGSPWLMLPCYNNDSMCYRFFCLAKNDAYSFFSNEHNRSPRRGGWKSADPDAIIVSRFVGSSHGWLALYDRLELNLFLSNPITDRHIKLPPVDTLCDVNRVILSSSPDERESLALMTFGSGKGLAFCSPLRSHEWTVFGGGGDDVRDREVYDDLVYSSIHKRLFCITSNTKLEVWDVGEGYPRRLDWMTTEFDFDRPARPGSKELKYIVCAEQTGELFLVVRHVILARREAAGKEIIAADKTVDFDAYKIDWELGKAMHMENSLEGLALFVGINHPFAIPAAEVSGLKPNSVYFTYDNRCRIPPERFGGRDNGIFDYQKRDVSPCCASYPYGYIDCPMWFTPPHNLISV